jgi:hypothetical protein
MLIILYSLLIFLAAVIVLYVLGQYTFWLPHRSWKLPRILMFHQVTVSEPASGMNVQPEKFEHY